ncbi:MAG: GNAT family N-acetyltransferase [Desulfobacterales bacterium]|nr:GNAT family N-acetyltransferase [Desulfobacterales bacterium]
MLASKRLAMIKLCKFESTDISKLLEWIPDARFLLQWAGPKYIFPLNRDQLMMELDGTKGHQPSHFMFKSIYTADKKTVGHIELMAVDYNKRTARLGRVLIGPNEMRSKGYGNQMIHDALKFGFEILNLNEIDLGVFDFNSSAIKCYQKIGFRKYEIRQNARKIQ